MLITIVWILTCVFGVLFGIFHFFGNRELYNKTNHINGPLAIPLIGSAYHFLGDSAHLIKQVLKMSDIYNSPFRVVLGSRIFFIITDPEQVKSVLQSPKTVEKDFVYTFAKPLVGNGLLTAEHKIWRVHRKIIQPNFNTKYLRQFVSIFSKNSYLLVQSIADKVGGPEFEIFPYIAFTSIANISESTMGVTVESQEEDVRKFYTLNKRVFGYLADRLIRVWLHSNFLFQFSQLSKNFYTCINYLHSFMDEVIQKRRENLEKDKIRDGESMATKEKTTLDLLLQLSHNGNQLNDGELRDQILAITLAGYDTVARTINFVLLMLTQSNVQEKVYKEMYSIYGSEDPKTHPVKFEDLQHFEYLERVIKETMRLFPVIPLVGRHVSEDLELDDSCIVPKGCSAIIFLLSLHRNEKFWTNPLKFDPDIFLPENSNERHQCAFIPFSFSSRDCIGRVYAMMSMKVVIATLLRKYIIKKDKFIEPGYIKLRGDTLLDTADPIFIRIENRVIK